MIYVDCLYLITTHANVVGIAICTITFSTFAPEDFAVAAESAARFYVHPRRSLHRDALLVHETLDYQQRVSKITILAISKTSITK